MLTSTGYSTKRIVGPILFHDEYHSTDRDACTTIRLPIGYFTLGANFCTDTLFAPYSKVYENAWASVKPFIARARSFGIGVLIDLHALPGGANKEEHSGTNSGTAALWSKKKNLTLAKECLVFIASEISKKTLEGVIGLQLCNEAMWDAPGMYQWYDSMISAISAVDPTIPLYISDAWNLGRAIGYAQDKNRLTSRTKLRTNPLCIDTHLYFCFTDDSKSPYQLITTVPVKLKELNGRDGSVLDKGAVQVVVGEWSCTMSGPTWSLIHPGDSRSQLTTTFGKTQCNHWEEKTGGSFFWTFKMDWMDGGDWGFVEQTKTGSVCAPSNLSIPFEAVKDAMAKAQLQRNVRGTQRFNEHVKYWDQAAPGKPFEHWRFENGWRIGWNDGLSFFSMRMKGVLGGNVPSGGDKIGCLDLWVRKRVGECTSLGTFAWEFEQGFRKGLQDFYHCVGI
jgi:aryl-phospho-beta-D-glucosidase BglC (GH1 family)